MSLSHFEIEDYGTVNIEAMIAQSHRLRAQAINAGFKRIVLSIKAKMTSRRRFAATEDDFVPGHV